MLKKKYLCERENGSILEKNYWFVLKTNSRAEKKVAAWLEDRKFEVYLPLFMVARQWSDRVKKVKIPLLPGFVFVRTSRDQLIPLLDTPGVFSYISYLKKPAVVKDYEINNIKILLNESTDIESIGLEQWSLGQEVKVTGGIFKGLTGRILKIKQHQYFLISITELGVRFQVKLPLHFFEKL